MPVLYAVRPLVKHFIRTMSKQRFLSLFLFFLLQRIHGVSSTFSSICNDTLCNGVKISYPFWTETETKTGNATPNVFCGYRGFGLRCSSDNKTLPILTLSGDTYYVRAINYDSDSITLASVEISDQPCPRVRRNVTINNLPLKVQSENSLKLNFYFNCSLLGGISEPPNRISCLDTGLSSNGSYVFEEEIEAAEFDWTKLCEDMVVVPVKETEPPMDNLAEEYTAAIKAGFVLEWDVAAECSGCVKSGGRCGFNNRTEQLVCFCKNSAMLTDGKFCKGGISLRKKIAIAGSSVAATAIVGMLGGMLVYLKYRKRRQGPYIVTRSVSCNYYSSRTGVETSDGYYGLPLFEYDELREATNNFDPGKELGDGGFGTVFYGKLGDGRAVAVKRLYENNYKRTAQFMNEVEILARLHHPNLVNLYGCTSRQSHRLLLIYEYVPNGTVADHLHGDLAKPGSLPWTIRMNIAIETASALVYLHASDIVHRDVKTNNILLDENFKVKVADFGLSRLFPMNVTHVSTAPQGTPGYVDPEYHQCYQLTDKSDVYSFGVVLMELISSLPAVDIMRHRQEINLSTMAMNKIQSDALHELVDVHLGFESGSDTRRMIEAVAELGFRCLQHGKDMRPSMAEVLSTLQDIQKQDSETDKVVVVRENDSPSDDVVLLKVGSLMLSPDSVMVKWPSMNPTPNTSA